MGLDMVLYYGEKQAFIFKILQLNLLRMQTNHDKSIKHIDPQQLRK